MVERLVSRGGARRRGLRCPAGAGGQERSARDRCDAVLQRLPLCATPLALDHRRAGLDHRLPDHRVAESSLSECRSGRHQRRYLVSGDAPVATRRLEGIGRRLIDRGLYVDHCHAFELGLLLRRVRLLEAIRAGRRSRAGVGVDRPDLDGHLDDPGGGCRGIENTIQGFEILLQIGAGTGLLFVLRWFWWRINPYSEIVAMVVSFAIAIWTEIFFPVAASDWIKSSVGVTDDGLAGFKLILGVVVTTIAWVLATIVTHRTMRRNFAVFTTRSSPAGSAGDAWCRAGGRRRGVAEQAHHIPLAIICIVAGCIAIYGALFAAGYLLYGNFRVGTIWTVITLAASYALWHSWMRIAGLTGTAGLTATVSMAQEATEQGSRGKSSAQRESIDCF